MPLRQKEKMTKNQSFRLIFGFLTPPPRTAVSPLDALPKIVPPLGGGWNIWPHLRYRTDFLSHLRFLELKLDQILGLKIDVYRMDFLIWGLKQTDFLPWVLRFGLVGDVLLAAQDPYPCWGVIFPKVSTHISHGGGYSDLDCSGMCCQQLKAHTHVLGFFFQKWVPMFRDFSDKSKQFLWFCHKNTSNFQNCENQTIVRDFIMKNGTHV